MVAAGFVITFAGVALFCAVSFASGIGTDWGEMLFRNGVLFTRATLAVLGLGTLVWLVGSFTYLRGAMDTEDDVSEESSP